MRADDLVLVPRPRHLDVGGDGPEVAGLTVREVRDPTLAHEGFRLMASASEGVRLAHRDDAGLRHGRRLLSQLVAQAPGGRLPELEVRDQPDVAVRGAMLDVSRDRVPTRATLERIVGVCELARLNQLQLYLEHPFAYVDHTDVWRHASPLRPDDLAWLDRRCAASGIELVPNQNTFGHFERWLAHDRYRARAECPEGWEPMPGVTMPPTVLAPTPDNADFVLSLLDELLPSFRSKRVNIGCDEPFELGHGASAADVATRGRGRVYLEHVRRLAEPLLARGYEVQLWADVLRLHPELASSLPEGVVPVTWCYEAPPPDGALELPSSVLDLLGRLGTDVAGFSGFAANADPIAETGRPFWVAPGTSSWCSLVGRIDNARDNAVDAAEAARRHGCEGLLVTDWGDHGHHQPLPVSLAPLVYAGAVAWGLDANRDLELPAVLDRFIFDDAAGVLGAALDRLGRLWRRTGQRAVNASPLHTGLFPGQPHLVLGRPDPDQVRGVVDELTTAVAALDAARPGCADGALLVDEVRQAARLARLGAWGLLGDAAPDPTAQAGERADVVRTQAAVWLARSRAGGLADSLRRLDPQRLVDVEIPDPASDRR